MSDRIRCLGCDRLVKPEWVKSYGGFERRCAEEAAREAMDNHAPVIPATYIQALIDGLDAERENLRAEQRGAQDEARRLAEEAEDYRRRAEDAEYRLGRW